MRLTTQLIVNNYSSISRSSVLGDDDRQKQQLIRDMSYAKRGYLCKKGIIESPTTMDLKSVYDVMDVDFYSPDAMQIPTCIAESISYIGQNTGMHKILLHLILSDIPTFIGEPSVEGYVSKVSHLFLMKTARDPSRDYVAHEFYVGSVLNRLRNLVPNFMYVYSLFRCSPPYTSKSNGGMITWCPMGTGFPRDNTEQVSYMLIENVTPSNSFASVMMKENINTIQLFTYLFQVFQSLIIARREFDFSHNDLHSGNVLLRKVPKMNKIAIRYGNLYLLTDRISTIIDYGMSRVSFEGISSSYHMGRRLGIDPDKSAIFIDVYKIICSLIQARGTGRNNDPIRDKMQLLLSYFVRTGHPKSVDPGSQYGKTLERLIPDIFEQDELIENTISLQSKIWFTLIDTPQMQGSNLDTFFDYFLAVFSPEIQNSIVYKIEDLNKRGYKLLSPQDTRLSYDKILKNILYKGEQLDTVEKFYYATQLFTEQFPNLNGSDMLRSLGPKINVKTTAIESSVNRIISLNNRIKSRLSNIRIRSPYDDIASLLKDHIDFQSLAVPFITYSIYYPDRYPKLTGGQVMLMRAQLDEYINRLKGQVVTEYEKNRDQRLAMLINSF